MNTKIISIFLLFSVFQTNAQRDSIIHFTPIDINVSDVALKYVNFYSGFEFVPLNNSLQSRIVQNSANHNLILKRNSASLRNLIYSGGKLRKIINVNSSGAIVAFDTLYYVGDTLKEYINHIVINNSDRLFRFYYDNNSLFPSRFKRVDQYSSFHFLKFNSNGQLLEDITAQTIDSPISERKKFTYNNLGNITNYYENYYYRYITFQEHDTSLGVYSASLPLKLYAYTKGLSDFAFSQNNPLKYTEVTQGVTINVLFTFTYSLYGYPIKITFIPDVGIISSEEFDYD